MEEHPELEKHVSRGSRSPNYLKEMLGGAIRRIELTKWVTLIRHVRTTRLTKRIVSETGLGSISPTILGKHRSSQLLPSQPAAAERAPPSPPPRQAAAATSVVPDRRHATTSPSPSSSVTDRVSRVVPCTTRYCGTTRYCACCVGPAGWAGIATKARHASSGHDGPGSDQQYCTSGHAMLGLGQQSCALGRPGCHGPFGHL